MTSLQLVMSAHELQISLGETILFWCLAPLAVFGALSLLFAKKAVYSAVGVVTTMVCLALMYVMNEAPFLGVAQIVVYTGAIMMLFLFVIMMVGVAAEESLVETIKGQRPAAILLSAGAVILFSAVFLRASYPPAQSMALANADSNPVGIAQIVFGDYVFTLEILGVLLTTAAVGALLMTHREKLIGKLTQKKRVDLLVATGSRLTPMPNPGVYSRSNAMDVPALGPDGKPVEASVSRVLRVRGQVRAPAEVVPQIDDSPAPEEVSK
jgi:NADH-quinone oxidoreductase subunit J